MESLTKKYSFYFHYNKPATLKSGKIVMSIHYRGACHLVNSIKCNVPTWTRFQTKSPKATMAGKAFSVEIVDDVALIH